MAILLHVLIAVSSIIYTGYAYVMPTRHRIYAGYGLVAATLISGTYLVVSLGSPLLGACTTGLTYLAVTATGLLFARRKLYNA